MCKYNIHTCVNMRRDSLDSVLMCFSPRRPSTDGTGGVEAWDGLTPLHLACIAGLDKIVQFLVQENAQVNAQVRCI